MNWTHRRPFRQQFGYGGTMNKQHSMNRPLTYRVSNTLSNLPIDAIRLELADYHPPPPPCPVHHHRSHPYRTTTTTTFDDRHQSSLQRALSSIRSVSTFESDFVHQRVSTIRQYPSSDSLIAQQEIINDPLLAINNNEHEDPPPLIESRTNDQPIEIEEQSSSSSSQCRSCLMLMDIVDQQTEQIRQYNDQISQQADLLAKLARRLAGIEEGIDEHKSNS